MCGSAMLCGSESASLNAIKKKEGKNRNTIRNFNLLSFRKMKLLRVYPIRNEWE